MPVKVLSVGSTVIIIAIINNPRYSYKDQYLLGPGNWGTEKCCDLHKIASQMNKWQSQSGFHHGSSQPFSDLIWAASWPLMSIPQTPPPWGLLQRAGQNDVKYSDVGKVLSTRQVCIITTYVMETAAITTGPCVSEDEVSAWLCLGLNLYLGQALSFPWTWGSHSWKWRWETWKLNQIISLILSSVTLCGTDPILTEALYGKWKMVGTVAHEGPPSHSDKGGG